MGYKKGNGSKSMTSPKGMCSTKTNPLPAAKMTQPTSGSPMGTPANKDQAKVRNLRKKAYAERDSHRGMNGI